MKKPNDVETQIGGLTWSIRFVRKGHPRLPTNCYGICYWNDQQIFVRYDLSPKTVRDTTIHEILHATCRMLFVAEEWVDHTATEINNALTKTGLYHDSTQ